MTMSGNWSKGILVLALCGLGFTAAVVNASLSDTLLRVPLFEVGSLWVNATQNIATKFQDTVFQMPDFNSLSTYLGLGVGSVVLYYLYHLLCVPMNRVRLLGDLGYIPEGKLSQKDMANLVRQRRKVGSIPPPFPNGWFSVLESRDLKKRDVRAVSVLGLDLAVFRGDDGRAHVVDAYCPHMGANLAAGGIVKGSCLECPFHGWKFRGDDGKCVHVPYAETKHIPEIAKVKSYITMEMNGFIYIWHHSDDIEPTWTPPELEEITRGEWCWGGRSEHIVNSHIEEVPENGADVAHLLHLHGPIMSAGIDLRFTHDRLWSWAKHDWDGAWDSDPENPHVGVLRLKHAMQFFGFTIPILNMYVTAKQIGPGIVYLTFDSVFGKGAYLQSLTPTEPLMQRMIHHVYFHWTVPTFIAKFFLLAEAMMVERDIMVWNNKQYIAKPVFVKSKEDALVAKHRRWYSQFYSESSKRLQFQKDSMDW